MGSDKRRSDRLMLTVPLVVTGVDAKGVKFRENMRTITLNRHGARIVSPRLLASGQTVDITNLVSRREAKFRVVGPLSPHSEKGGEWGVECLDGQENIWGIKFPPLPSGQEPDSAALLECRQCHTVALLRVSLVEFEVLGASGIMTRACESCKENTPWGYAEKQVAMSAPSGATASADAVVSGGPAKGGVDLRRHRRVSLQLPVLVRGFSGEFEITKSENVSKGGFCFSSEKDFHVGEGIMVACPYSRTDQNPEVGAKITRRQVVEGSNRKIYGVRYSQK
ncbi:MAG TPA: PilZ domain-containing protein [Terriglobia bacterium]|nr:PilZ domain-containing protein [Terriglobia bacterium]